MEHRQMLGLFFLTREEKGLLDWQKMVEKGIKFRRGKKTFNENRFTRKRN